MTMVSGTDHDHDTLEFTPWSMVKKNDHDHDNLELTNFDHLTTVILKFWQWSWSKMTNFDHLTTVILKFWPWSWSKIFDHLTLTPRRRPNGQKIMVILPPPPPLILLWSKFDHLADSRVSLSVPYHNPLYFQVSQVFRPHNFCSPFLQIIHNKSTLTLSKHSAHTNLRKIEFAILLS